MSIPLSLDFTRLEPDVTLEEILSWQDAVSECHEQLHSGTGPGSKYRGWLDPHGMIPEAEVERITQAADELRNASDVLVVVGIGGSYLGARAVIEALGGRDKERVIFAGQNISASYHKDLLDSLDGKRVAVNIVSKSGTTTEPAIAFRLLRNYLKKKRGGTLDPKLIVATTDPQEGALREMSRTEGYRTFVVPGDLGGRYSVLSAVGLLPIAYAGLDVRKMIDSAADCAKACENPDLEHNPAYLYAVIRNILYRKGKAIEILATFEPRLHYLAEWWKQLFGESEGKSGVSIFPASVEFTTDLHSMGQWIQEGRRIIFETFTDIEGGEPELRVPKDPTDADELNYLSGKTLHEVNRMAYRATSLAHREGGVPNLTLRMPRLDETTLGALLYFFEKACAISGYLLGVNPFDQPGVQLYKDYMFALLGKPGYEGLLENIEKSFESEDSNS
ncbi:MAG: glucose-6-phosphate isomerase [Armatimonadota bacterium]|nr:glucose-6-phosphate isomerase [Armatimonadota bacterium]